MFEKVETVQPRKFKTSRGHSIPLGASPVPKGVNFSVMTRHGTAVWLVIYPIREPEPLGRIELDPDRNRTGNHWHVQVSGLPAAFRYGWQVDGPAGPTHRFSPETVLLDPAATAISDGDRWGQFHEANGQCPERRSLFFRRSFAWEGDSPPRTPLEDSIIYELHVRGFTCHPSAAVAHPGTFAGLTEKIPYLRSLGITTVELLPIHEFDECDCPFTNPFTGERNRNFWGYNSIAFAAPKAAYASSAPEFGQVAEFREMVKSFHQAGIEVFLDVVFNHTGEGDDRGRTMSFRGLDNQLYYMLNPEGEYLNFSGCGNTLNCNHPVVRHQIMNCIRYWVAEMHVDGLRFDLASVFGRDRHGNILVEPPIVESMAEDSVLADTKLIAEPWDAAGLYQVGTFPFGQRWSEWNGRFRDDVRRFWRGEKNTAAPLASRLCGSADLYEKGGRLPRHSINFVTAHDGFTLWDLVSYNQKHNQANGEDNRDGHNDNLSWNCGVEGPSDDPHVLNLRYRQAKNFMVTLLVAQGVPMLLAGDEFLRTQQGNNNAWCQDNELSWVDWDLANRHSGFLRFVRELIALRRNHSALRRRAFFGSDQRQEGEPDIIWHGVRPCEPDFSEDSHSIAFTLNGQRTGRENDLDFYIVLNAWQDSLRFELPGAPSGTAWMRVVDTAKGPPEDFVSIDDAARLGHGSIYEVAAHSSLILLSSK